MKYYILIKYAIDDLQEYIYEDLQDKDGFNMSYTKKEIDSLKKSRILLHRFKHWDAHFDDHYKHKIINIERKS